MAPSKFVALLLVCLVMGCGATNFESTAVTPPSPIDNIRTSLQNIADTGEVGSGAAEIRQKVEELKVTDAAKGDALMADLDKLETAKDPAAAKAIATEMLGKL